MAETMKLTLVPTQAAYAVEDSTSGVIYTELDGGPPRFRKDNEGAPARVNVQWVVTGAGYDYLTAFKRVHENQLAPFLIDLIIGEADLRACTAMMIPQTFRLQEVQGPTFTVAAQLVVTPPEYNLDDDLILIWLVGEFGAEWEAWINRLHYIINVEWPGMTNTPDNLWG